VAIPGNRSRVLTGYSELTFAPRLRLLTGDMEAAGHEEEVMLKTQTQRDKIPPAPARSRTRENRPRKDSRDFSCPKVMEATSVRVRRGHESDSGFPIM
jgi:hypothetical protein